MAGSKSRKAENFTFNRTTIELKPRKGYHVRIPVKTFNRTTIELKLSFLKFAPFTSLTFNRTTIELKP